MARFQLIQLVVSTLLISSAACLNLTVGDEGT